MNVLGISCFFHDAAGALIRGGTLVAAAEERLTRKRHDYEFPENAMRFCLEKGKMVSAELDYVVFFEKPFVKFERILTTSLQTFQLTFLYDPRGPGIVPKPITVKEQLQASRIAFEVERQILWRNTS